MAKVKGPLFSLSASGNFQGLIEFRTGDGQTVAAGPKAYIPPRTLAQAEQTNRFKDAVVGWRSLDPAQKATWATLAPSNTSGYRLYISEYLNQNIYPPDQPQQP